MDARDAAFFAGASLALLDTILRENPPFAGALRQRLALRAAAACAKMARLREDAAALRDAEHLAPGGRRDDADQPRRAHSSALAPVRVPPNAAGRLDLANRR
jgi:hypothetical protein